MCMEIISKKVKSYQKMDRLMRENIENFEKALWEIIKRNNLGVIPENAEIHAGPIQAGRGGKGRR